MRAERPDSRRERADEAISQAASRWLARRDRGLSAREILELETWKAADPRHATELSRLEAAWRDCDRANAAPELVAMAHTLERETRIHTRRATPRWRATLLAAAAAIPLAAGLAWWRLSITADVTPTDLTPRVRVIASVAHRIVLDDGSMVDVREGGEIRPEFSAAERRVQLVRGEAHFTVKGDATRPFVVRVGETSVRAVGTAFNVRLDPERVEILVTEGKVQVIDAERSGGVRRESLPLVVAGQRAVVEREARARAQETPSNVDVAPAAPADLEKVLSWQSTRLVFDRTPLDEAVAAFNRHSALAPGVRLVIGDPALRTRRLGGTIRAANVDGFVRLLEQSVEVRAEHRGEQIVLLPAH